MSQICSNNEEIALLKKQLEERRKNNEKKLHDFKTNADKKIADEVSRGQKAKLIFHHTGKGGGNLAHFNSNSFSSTACSSEECTTDQEKI